MNYLDSISTYLIFIYFLLVTFIFYMLLVILIFIYFLFFRYAALIKNLFAPEFRYLLEIFWFTPNENYNRTPRLVPSELVKELFGKLLPNFLDNTKNLLNINNSTYLYKDNHISPTYLYLSFWG